MWIFRFTFQEMATGSERVEDYRFDFFGYDEREAYVHAMLKAYDMARGGECLVSVALLAC